MKRITVFLVVQMIFFECLTAQNVPDQVLGIRDKYNRITKDYSLLQQINIKGTEYYLNGNSVAIIKSKIPGGYLESYYTTAENDYTLYFIYYNSSVEPDKSDVRVYLDDREGVIKLVLGQSEKNYFENRKLTNNLILKSNNALNNFFNLFELAKHPEDKLSAEILGGVNKIDSDVLVCDTVKFVVGDEGGHFEQGQFNYYNSLKELVKTVEYSAGEHGTNWTSTYFEEGRKLCLVTEAATWAPFFDFVASIQYFRRGRITYRTDSYSSYNVELQTSQTVYSIFHYEVGELIPRISYN